MAAETKSEAPARLEFHYQKSNFFRVVYASGAYGGVTPRGDLHFALYNERAAIPKKTSAEIGKPGPERVEDRLSGVVREVEVDVIMDLNAALSFSVWLDEKVEFLRKAAKIADSDWARIREEAGAARKAATAR